MTKDQDFMHWDKREYEMLEEEMQTLLQSPVPLDPSFKRELRAELLREHQRLYGQMKPAKRRFPLGIVSGTAAALLLFSTAVYLSQSDGLLNRAGLDGSKKDLVLDQPAGEPRGIGHEGTVAEEGGPDSTSPAKPSDPREPLPSDEKQFAQAERSDERHATGSEARNGGSSAPVSEGHAPSKPSSPADVPPVSRGEKNPPASLDEPAAEPWQREVPVDREFVFSSSTITMSRVVPFRAEHALPSNIHLQVSEDALPREKQVFTYAEQLPYDIQQRQALAQALGLGDNEEATTRGFRYRGRDGSTLLFRTDGLPHMEYAYRGPLENRAASLDGEQQVEIAADFLQKLQISVAGMSIKVNSPSGATECAVSFVPELAGVPNLAGTMTVTLKQGQVVEASIPLLAQVQAKPAPYPLVSLTEVLQRVAMTEEYLIRPDEKVTITEAELVYYQFGKGMLEPAYQLRGVEEKSGKLVQLIASAVQE